MYFSFFNCHRNCLTFLNLFQILNFDEVDNTPAADVDNFIDDGAKDTTPTDAEYDPQKDEVLTYNLAKYHTLIPAVLSSGLSNRKTAKIINSLFVDEKIDAYISPEKVRLLKQKHLRALTKKHEEETKNLIGIGVDGKCGLVKEIHCQSSSKDKESMTNSVTGNYIDHDIPVESSGEGISDGVFKILQKYRSTETIVCLNMDGCKVNTGAHQGVLRHLEAMLQRPLTWIICSLHCNEKVFDHLFEAIGELFQKSKLCVRCPFHSSQRKVQCLPNLFLLQKNIDIRVIQANSKEKRDMQF